MKKTKLKSFAKTFCRSLLPVVYMLLPVSVTAVAEPVKDVRYGVALYHFFQEDYFPSLVELMSAKQQGVLQNHVVNAELLRGGISLSYGLDRNAELVFSSMLVQPKSEEGVVAISEQQRNKAWFYLGKLIYQQGDFDRSLTALENVTSARQSASVSDYQIESAYLRATMLISEGRHKVARQQMLAVPESSSYWPYYYFNLGSSYAKQKLWALSVNSFNKADELLLTFGNDPLLRDRANTAAGYANIARQNYVRAIQSFSKVSLNSHDADKALLGYGLAESERDNYRQALAPWQTLRSQSLLLPAVQEVMLALPYAYEKMGAQGSALTEYQAAASSYRQEIEKLTAAITAFEQQPLTELFSLTSLNQGWLSKQELPPIDKNTIYIAHLVAKHKFQAVLRDYYDLSVLKENLVDVGARYKNLLAVDGEQQAHWQQVVDDKQLESYEARRDQLLASRDALAKRIKLAEKGGQPELMAQGNTYELLQLVNKAKQGVNRLVELGENVSYEREQLQRYEQLLVWESNENFSGNNWHLKKKLAELDAQLTISNGVVERLHLAVEAKNISEFAERLQSVEQRLNNQQLQIGDALNSKSNHIRHMAVDELTVQKNQLQQYLARATLSIARLYDLGSQQTILPVTGGKYE